MAAGRFLFFILLIAAGGALLAAWLFPIIKKWFMKYQRNIELRNQQVDEEMLDEEEHSKEETEPKTYY